MSKGTKRSKRVSAKDDDDDESYMELEDGNGVAEAKESEGCRERTRLELKAQMLEEELDREVDEEFERLRRASMPAPPVASPKTHVSRSARAREIRRSFKM